MEYSYIETDSSVDVIWNGPSEEMCKKLVITGRTEEHHMKIFLFYPKMPTNHVSCLIKRFQLAWKTNVGIGKKGTIKAFEALKSVEKSDGIIFDNNDLIPILEYLELDDVAVDLDLIAIKLKQRQQGITSIWGFAFVPDLTDHFLKNVKINGDTICYGRNGDLSL